VPGWSNRPYSDRIARSIPRGISSSPLGYWPGGSLMAAFSDRSLVSAARIACHCTLAWSRGPVSLMAAAFVGKAGLLGLARIVGRVEIGHSDRSNAAQLDDRLVVGPLVMVHALRKMQVTAGN
jgi:hypothetical protein